MIDRLNLLQKPAHCYYCPAADKLSVVGQLKELIGKEGDNTKHQVHSNLGKAVNRN